MNTLFVNASALLEPSSGNSLRLFQDGDLADARTIAFGNQLWQVIEN